MAGEDRDYLAWLAWRRCCAPGGCGQLAEAHHPRHGVGMALRAHDHRAVPLCRQCHIDIEQHRGRFDGWSKGRVAEWCDLMGAHYRRLYEESENGLIPF
jgi:hypothetical protein